MKKIILFAAILLVGLPVSNAFGGGVDENTALLLHCDGKNGARDFTDSSNNNHSVMAKGNVYIDTSQKKFGSASCLFDGAGDYLEIPDSEDWYFGNGDFTIDFWIRFARLPSLDAHQMTFICQQKLPHSHMSYFSLDNDGQYGWYLTVQSLDGKKSWMRFLTDLLVDTWYHVAVVREGQGWYVFQDGVLCGPPEHSDINWGDYDGPLYIGIYSDDKKSYPFQGWLDEIRISKGIARWTSDFIPTDSEYNGDFTADIVPKASASMDVKIKQPSEMAIIRDQIRVLQQQNKYLLEQVPQLKKKIEGLEAQEKIN